MEGLNDIKELWAMTNAILAVIAMATILLGYWLTQQQPAPAPARVGLGQIGRRARPGFIVLTSGHVRPDKRTYIVNGEAHYLPVGVSVPAGRRVALVMLNGEGR